MYGQPRNLSYAKNLELPESHMKLFTGLATSLGDLARALKRVGGDYCHEWRAKSGLWGDERIQKIIRMLSLKSVYFDGCALGLTSRKGRPIRKPWVFQTSTPQIVDKF